MKGAGSGFVLVVSVRLIEVREEGDYHDHNMDDLR